MGGGFRLTLHYCRHAVAPVVGHSTMRCTSTYLQFRYINTMYKFD
ncbi:hypothetical protein TI01_1839 [Lysobacter sp. A03]|nr:hypothetical protein TI01_1839 [Lysobacter sp. A03]